MTDGTITERDGQTGKATARKISQPQLSGREPRRISVTSWSIRCGKAFGRIGGSFFCLRPGKQASVKVRFKPTNTNRTGGKLVIASTGNRSTVTVKLTGRGKAG